jgi:hypothetical protein
MMLWSLSDAMLDFIAQEIPFTPREIATDFSDFLSNNEDMDELGGCPPCDQFPHNNNFQKPRCMSITFETHL